MKKDERIHEVNDQAALNNNMDAATLQANQTIAKQHKKPTKDHQGNKRLN